MDNLDKEYADAEKLGRCALSGKTWLDALKTGDCLCVPMEFYRPPGG